MSERRVVAGRAAAWIGPARLDSEPRPESGERVKYASLIRKYRQEMLARTGSDRGASSVVGALLLVAVTVVAGATVAVFALDIAESEQDTAPTGSFEIETCNLCGSLADPESGERTNFINITYTNGETLDAENVRVTLDGTVLFDPSKTGQAAYEEPANYDGAGPNQLRWSTRSIEAGDRLILEDDADDESTPATKFSEGQTIRVVWYSPDSDQTAVLTKRTIEYG